MATRRIGELLVAEGLLSEADVRRALGYQRQAGDRMKLGSILMNWYLLPEASLLAALAKFHGCPGVGWTELAAAESETVRLLPAAHAIRLAAIPYRAEKGFLRVAFVNPSNLAGIDEVAQLTGRPVQAGVTTEARLLQAQRRFLGRHVPLEYRQILQKLDRPRAAPLPPVERDFHSSDPVEIKGAATPPRLWTPDGKAAAPALPAVELPVFPKISGIAGKEAAASWPGGRRSTDDGLVDDSLSDWVGRAIGAFRGDPTPETPVLPSRETDIPETIPPFRRANDPIARATAATPRPGAEDAAEDAARDGPGRNTDMSIAPGVSTPAGSEAHSRDEIADSVLQGSLSGLPRVLLLGAGKAGVTGWRGRGPGLSASRIAAVRIPGSETSVFSSVQASGIPHFGPTDRSEWPRELADLLGEAPPDCAVFPIRILDGVAAFLYADRLGQPMRYEDFAAVAHSAASAAKALSRFLLRPDYFASPA